MRLLRVIVLLQGLGLSFQQQCSKHFPDCTIDQYCAVNSFGIGGSCASCEACRNFNDPIDGTCPTCACNFHSDCPNDQYCDDINNCDYCSICETRNDAVDGVCPFKCTDPETEAPATTTSATRATTNPGSTSSAAATTRTTRTAATTSTADTPTATSTEPDYDDTRCEFLGSTCMEASQCTGQTASGLCGGPSSRKCCYTDYNPTFDRIPSHHRCQTSETAAFNCGGAFDNGRLLGQASCVCIDGKPVTTMVSEPFRVMRAAAQRDSEILTITSGFRTNSEQEYFYRCYQIKELFGVTVCNNGNLAAVPGTSNHQKGTAIDVSTNEGENSAYTWLINNAHKFGFVRTVPKETWHWEYRPSSASCDSHISVTCRSTCDSACNCGSRESYSCEDRNTCTYSNNTQGVCVGEDVCTGSTVHGQCPSDGNSIACCNRFEDPVFTPSTVDISRGTLGNDENGACRHVVVHSHAALFVFVLLVSILA